MAADFDKALEFVLQSEGGKVDNPRDPGGRTNEGVTQAVFTAWLEKQGKPSRDVYLITATEVSAIYKTQYADVVHFDDLPSGLDYAVFDGGVMSGPVESARWLQRAVGAKDDGHIGLLTLAAVKKADPVATIVSVCEERLTYCESLSTWKTFGAGWKNRVAAVQKNALAMAAAPAPTPELDAIEAAVAKASKAQASPTIAGPHLGVVPIAPTPSPGWLARAWAKITGKAA